MLFCDGIMWGFHIPRYFALGILILYIYVYQYFKDGIQFRINWLDISVIVFIGYLILNALITTGGGDLYNRLDVAIFLLLYFFIPFLLFNSIVEVNNCLMYSFNIISISGVLLALYGTLQYIGFDVFRSIPYPSAESRAIATMGNPNSLGGYLAASFPFIIFQYRKQNGRIKNFALLISGVLIVTCMILTVSRGAWIALLSGVIVLKLSRLLDYWRQTDHKYILLFLSVLFTGIFVYILYTINPLSALGRIYVWKVSANIFLNYPVFGVGYGGYGLHFLNYQALLLNNPINSKYIIFAGNLKGAKNEILQIATETGIIGLILFLVLLFILYKYIIHFFSENRSRNHEQFVLLTLISSIVTILVHAQFDNVMYVVPVSLLFWYNISMISLLIKSHLSHEYSSSLFACKLTSCKSYLGIKIVSILLFFATLTTYLYKLKGYSHWQAGQHYIHTNFWSKGIHEYEKAADILPNIGELKFHLASAYTYSKYPEKAIRLLEEAKKDFNDKNLYIVEGYALIQRGFYAEAESCFHRAIAMYPDLLLPRLWLSTLYIKLNRMSDAHKNLKDIISIKPKLMNEEVKKIKKDAKNLLSKYDWDSF